MAGEGGGDARGEAVTAGGAEDENGARHRHFCLCGVGHRPEAYAPLYLLARVAQTTVGVDFKAKAVADFGKAHKLLFDDADPFGLDREFAVDEDAAGLLGETERAFFYVNLHAQEFVRMNRTTEFCIVDGGGRW